MAKKVKNSGIERQAAIMGSFQAIAKAGESGSSAAAQCIAQGVKTAAQRAELRAKREAEPRMSFRFLATGK